jgi:hypothetical protein
LSAPDELLSEALLADDEVPALLTASPATVCAVGAVTLSVSGELCGSLDVPGGLSSAGLSVAGAL